jgi:pimeloyl-ACP methyl ester carboxylesterase
MRSPPRGAGGGRAPPPPPPGAGGGWPAPRDSTPDLAGIGVPTLVVTSDRDTLIAPDLTTPMAGQVPGAKLAVIPDAGHLSNLEAPTRFDELLGAHLTRCGLPG